MLNARFDLFQAHRRSISTRPAFKGGEGETHVSEQKVWSILGPFLERSNVGLIAPTGEVLKPFAI